MHIICSTVENVAEHTGRISRSRIESVSPEGTLGRKSHGETLPVRTIVVYHVLAPDRPEPVLSRDVELLSQEPFRGFRPARRLVAPGHGAGVVVEVPERGLERGQGPVGLDEAAPSRPVIGVPYAAEYSHRLALEVRDAGRLRVLEHPYGCVVDVNSELH